MRVAFGRRHPSHRVGIVAHNTSCFVQIEGGTDQEALLLIHGSNECNNVESIAWDCFVRGNA